MSRKVEHLTGALDRKISELMLMSKELAGLDMADRQTLKHHSEDLIAASQMMLQRLKAYTNLESQSITPEVHP